MSKTIDQRVVEMRFDNAQFERGIAQSMNSINNLKESLDFSGLSTRGINDLTKDIGGISTSVDSIADKFTTFGIIGATALGKITTAAMDMGASIKEGLTRDIKEGYDKYNIMMESIQTIMYGTRDQIGEGLKWADQEEQMDYVTDQIKKLNWYTDETSYDLTDMTNNLGKFVANGVSLEDATTAMMGISSWAAMSGQKADAAARAMYNLSQALAIGKVTVADWKSIELANMATSEFKHEVVDLAFEMGKLHETEEGWYATYNDKGKEVLVAYDNIRGSLSSGWFDNDVLTAILKKYGDFADDLYDSVEKTGLTATELLKYSKDYKKALENGEDMTQWVIDLAHKDNIYNYNELGESLAKLTTEYNELGRQSFMAAQECKTFEDVVLATRDAATSAWMGIYTAIFGNYLQSKELWTSVAEEMYEVLVEGVAAKRNLLQRWNDIGGRDHLVNALWNIWYNIKDVMNAFTEAFGKLFPEKNAVQLLSYAVAFERWTEALRFSSFPWMDDLSNLYDIALNVATAFSHVTNAFKSVGDAAKKAWERIFPKSTTPLGTLESRIIEKILELSEDFEKFTSVLEFTDEQSKKLERTFAGLFAILDIGRMFIATLLEPLTGIKAEVIDIKDPILDVTAAIGDWLVAWRNWIKEHQYFKTLISWIMDFVSKIPAKVEKILNDLFGIGLQDVWEMIKTGAYYAFGAVYMLFTNLPKYAEMATQALFNCDLTDFFNNIKTIINSVWSVVQSFFLGLPISSRTATKGLEMAGLAGSFWYKIVKWVTDTKVTIWDFFGGLPGKINLVSKLLFHTDLKTFWDNFVGWVTSVGDAVVKLFSEIIPEKVDDLCKYIFGSDLETIWDNLKKKVTDTGTSVKDFFADIPNKVKRARDAFYGSKLYEFWTKFKITVQDAWGHIKNFFLNFPTYVNDLCIKLFGSDLETWWANLVENVKNTWINTRDFFINLPAKADEACQKLFKSDFATFFENSKTNISGAWESVVYFFTHLPEEANKATQSLFGTDFGTWWEEVKKWCSEAGENITSFFTDLPGKIEWLKSKVNELRDTIEHFFTDDIPNKLNEWSNKIFHKNLNEIADDVTGAVGKIKEAWNDFWGIGEKFEEPEMGVVGDNEKIKGWGFTDPDFWTNAKKRYDMPKSGIDQIKDYVHNMIEALEEAGLEIQKFVESPTGKSMMIGSAVLIGIAAILAGFYLLVTKTTTLISTIENFDMPNIFGGGAGALTNFLGQLDELVAGITAVVKKIGKQLVFALAFKLIADAVLEIVASIVVLSMVEPAKLAKGIGIIAGIGAGMYYLAEVMANGGVNPVQLFAIAAVFQSMGNAVLEMAAAIALLSQYDFGSLLVTEIAIGAFIFALFKILEHFGKNVINAQTIIDMSMAMVVVGVALIEIAIAFRLLETLNGEQILAAGAAMTGVMIMFALAVKILSSSSMVVGDLIAIMSTFALSMLAIGAGFALAGAAIWLVCDAIEKLSNIGPEGIDNMMYGLTSFFDQLPHGAEKVGEAMVRMCEVFNENSETFKETALNIADIILSVFELVIPRISRLLVDGLIAALDQLMAAMPTILAFLEKLLTTIIDLIIDMGPKVGELLMSLGELGLSILLGLTPQITAAAIALLIDTLNQVFENIGEVTALLTAILLETIVGTIDGLAIGIPRIMEALWNFVIIILNAFADGIEAHTPDIKAALQRARDAISHFFVEIFGWDPFEGSADGDDSNWLEYGAKLIKSLANGLESARSYVEGVVKDVSNAILNAACDIFGVTPDDVDMSKNSFSKIAMNLLQGLYNKFVPDEVRAKIKEWANALLDKVCEVFGLDKDNLVASANNGEFYKIAAQLIQGFINAITNVGQQAWSAITGWAQGVIDAAASTFDEHSPSRVFYDIGRYVDEGFANAVEDYAYLSENATAEMAEGSIGAVAGAIATISDMVNDEMDVDPVIRPVLDLSDIAAGTEMMDSMFNNNRSIDLAANSNISSNVSQQASLYSAFEDLKNALNGFKNTKGVTNNNVFNITGDDPRAIANEVSRILQEDVERTGAVWV